MPLERIVEFRIAAPIDVLPDVIFYIGKTKAAMFEERPQRLARPRDPEAQQYLRKLDEILSLFSQYYQPNLMQLPKIPLTQIFNNVFTELRQFFIEVRGYAEDGRTVWQAVEVWRRR
ncbi:MAG: ATPase, partial [Thermoproteus sp.]